jgi:microsomal dipeptidase-like Zn-dependent dipeptidase
MMQLKMMVEKGAFIEYTLAAYTHTTPIPKTHYYVEREYASIDEGMSEGLGGGVKLAAEQIQKLGADYCIIATDFGVYTLPDPVEGLREFIACLLDMGIPIEDIRKLVKTNPERLLGLET